MIATRKQYEITAEAAAKFADELSSAPESLNIDARLFQAQVEALRAMYNDLLEEMRVYRQQVMFAHGVIEHAANTGFFEALAIHAEALRRVAASYPMTPEAVIIESTQEYLDLYAFTQALYVQYMGEIADHGVHAMARAGYPPEAIA